MALIRALLPSLWVAFPCPPATTDALGPSLKGAKLFLCISRFGFEVRIDEIFHEASNSGEDHRQRRVSTGRRTTWKNPLQEPVSPDVLHNRCSTVSLAKWATIMWRTQHVVGKNDIKVLQAGVLAQKSQLQLLEGSPHATVSLSRSSCPSRRVCLGVCWESFLSVRETDWWNGSCEVHRLCKSYDGNIVGLQINNKSTLQYEHCWSRAAFATELEKKNDHTLFYISRH